MEAFGDALRLYWTRDDDAGGVDRRGRGRCCHDVRPEHRHVWSRPGPTAATSTEAKRILSWILKQGMHARAAHDPSRSVAGGWKAQDGSRPHLAPLAGRSTWRAEVSRKSSSSVWMVWIPDWFRGCLKQANCPT